MLAAVVLSHTSFLRICVRRMCVRLAVFGRNMAWDEMSVRKGADELDLSDQDEQAL